MAERHPDTDDKRLTLIFLIPKGNQLRRRYYLWSIKLLNMHQGIEPERLKS
jgi:DNA-binding MarR family transcriptional regulator